MMKIDLATAGVSSLIEAYLTQQEDIQPHYQRFPIEDNYFIQAKEKLALYPHREVLCEVLKEQLFGLALYPKQKENLTKLHHDNTVTITTGHQLNLLTGPLYFIYKILHTIKLCDTLNQKQSDTTFVPVYWMATEDHDFLEINHFNTYKKTYSYKTNSGGYVGEISADKALNGLYAFMQTLPQNEFGKDLKNMITRAYNTSNDMASATKTLVNELLGKYGILILDGNHVALKRLMIPYFEQELLHHPSQEKIFETNQALSSYKNQAYAREINLFYHYQNQRERITLEKGQYILNGSKKKFTKQEIIKELRQHPENFSPNVILRPLYQEIILPNVAYVGGGGEIAYWLQLKNMFAHYEVVFPMLVLRNSMLLLPKAMYHKANSLDLLPHKIFEPRYTIKREKIEKNSPLFEQLDELKSSIEQNFDALEIMAKKTGDDFAKMLKAQKIKQMNGYQQMQHRLYLAEQKQQKVHMQKIDEVYDYVYPQNLWQERIINFSTFYVTHGPEMFDQIYDAMDAFNSSYHLLVLDSILK